MDLVDILRHLAEADAGQRQAEMCGGHYIVVGCDDLSEYDEYEEEGAGTTIGEASSLYDALDLLAAVIVEQLGDDWERWAEDVDADGITSPSRRVLASFLTSDHGPMDTVTDDFWDDAYLGAALTRFPGARFVFLTSAIPPYQDVAFAILEHQPTGTDGLDGRGMAPLHHAVARRDLAAVRSLLDDGADPCQQADFGNSPHFAAVDGTTELVGPCADRIEDAEHWQILRMLVEAGAQVNATNLEGATLLDLAMATTPCPEEAVGFLRGADVQAGHRGGRR